MKRQQLVVGFSLGVAVCGLGNIGSMHIESLRSLRGSTSAGYSTSIRNVLPKPRGRTISAPARPSTSCLPTPTRRPSCSRRRPSPIGPESPPRRWPPASMCLWKSPWRRQWLSPGHRRRRPPLAARRAGRVSAGAVQSAVHRSPPTRTAPGSHPGGAVITIAPLEFSDPSWELGPRPYCRSQLRPDPLG